MFGQLTTSQYGDFEYKNLPDNAAGYGVTRIFNMGITIAGRGIFAPERLQYIREFSSGTSVTSYFISKEPLLLATTLPLLLHFRFRPLLHDASPCNELRSLHDDDVHGR